MSFNSRQQRILELARSQPSVDVEALARQFQVTPQTIRRDLNELCDSGLLERMHGGARLPTSVENVHYDVRQHENHAAKQAIAEKVADAIPDRASLFINIGTTTEAVAVHLTRKTGLHVITNNLNVAAMLADKPDFNVFVAGGQVRCRDRAVIGQSAIAMFQQFKVDYAVIGISGIDMDGTLLDYDDREVRVAQTIVANSRRVFLVADHSKFGRSAMVRMGSVDQIHDLFTDRPPPEELAEHLREAGCRIHLASVPEG